MLLGSFTDGNHSLNLTFMSLLHAFSQNYDVLVLVYSVMCNRPDSEGFIVCENKDAVMKGSYSSSRLSASCTCVFGYRPVLILQAGKGALELLLVLVLQVGQQHVLSAG